MIEKIKRRFYLIETLYGSAVALFSTVIYLYMENIGYRLTEINVFISVFWVVSFIGEIPSGVFSDSYGRRNTAILSCITRGIGLLVLFFDNGNILFLIISGILTAIGSSLYSGSMNAWAIDEIEKIDPNYDFNKIFSKGKIIGATVSLAAGYAGAQVIGVMDLGYPIMLSAMILFLTGIVLVMTVQDDNPHKEVKGMGNSFGAYGATIVSSIQFLKKSPLFFIACCSFACAAFLSTPAYNQWQLYFQNEQLGLISGYIHIFISIFGMAGAYFVSKIKIKNQPVFFIGCNVLIFGTLALAVFIENLYVSLLFFFIHVLVLTAEGVVQFTFLNVLLTKDTRTSMLSLYYAFDALITVVIMALSGWIYDLTDLGMSWVILGIAGLCLSLPLLCILAKGKLPEDRKAEI